MHLGAFGAPLHQEMDAVLFDGAEAQPLVEALRGVELLDVDREGHASAVGFGGREFDFCSSVPGKCKAAIARSWAALLHSRPVLLSPQPGTTTQSLPALLPNDSLASLTCFTPSNRFSVVSPTDE